MSNNKMVHCKTCGAEMAKGARACPNCGASSWGTSKLIHCKTCGGVVAKNANVCPHCGAKRNQALVIVSSVIIVLWVFFVTFSILSRENQGNAGSAADKYPLEQTETPSTSDQNKEAISISAKDLWSAYSDNAVNADGLYKGELLAVSGTISNIGQDIVTKAPCVSLETNDPLGIYSVQCFFPKNGDQTDQIAALSDGDVITIFGTCDGVPIANVQLSHCYLE